MTVAVFCPLRDEILLLFNMMMCILIYLTTKADKLLCLSAMNEPPMGMFFYCRLKTKMTSSAVETQRQPMMQHVAVARTAQPVRAKPARNQSRSRWLRA